ncbi:MAG TPA: hypothetical protein DDW33_14110 [Ktedonobacter sp.]|jgi:hypothetical protein|nr:hypothetical protein [Ktedonobacter sp.]HAT45898.1 hypothetical protein [Ktedonobacter sp.]HBE26806.1 hypothetical protein [Ktedonobacter sp.]HBE29752.1 hypothetical protein [Ktedonobacter sp.]HCF86316.1 hypothetical protein [Ktedonobacter sp.]
MFQQEEMRDAWKDEPLGYAGDARYEEASLYSSAGQKLIREAPGQAPTAVQRLTLALVSLGMLMGTTILLTIVAAKTGAPGWVAFPFLFVLTVFTAAVVSINVVFNHGVR